MARYIKWESNPGYLHDGSSLPEKRETLVRSLIADLVTNYFSVPFLTLVSSLCRLHNRLYRDGVSHNRVTAHTMNFYLRRGIIFAVVSHVTLALNRSMGDKKGHCAQVIIL